MKFIPRQKKLFPIIIILLTLFGIGILAIIVKQQTNLLSKAAQTTSLEPENGVLSGNVSILNDQSASNGKYAQFTTSSSLKPTCTDKLQDKINAATSGQTILVRTDCIYREQILINKSLTLDGQGGAQIRGSDVWDNATWTQSGNTWVSNKVVPVLPRPYGSCQGNIEDAPCHWPEQVFINDSPLEQVATTSAVTSGQFKLSPTRQIILSDNPIGKTIEVTTRGYWMRPPANLSVSNVTIQGFTMKHAATPAQGGAISTSARQPTDNWAAADEPKNWTIKNNTLSDAHGKPLLIGCTEPIINRPRPIVDSGGSGHKILNNDISRGGNSGIGGCNFYNTSISQNKIHHNNTEGFAMGWEAGGLKVASNTHDVIMDSNEVYENEGPGLWCDGNCNNITYSNNRIYNNARYGISQEISNRAIIFGNVIWNNGWVFPNWGFGAGILCQNCSNSEIYDNIVAWNGDGISILEQNRPDYDYKFAKVHDNYVHDNIIIKDDDPSDPNDMSLGFMSDWKQADGTYQIFSPEANNRGANNRYWLTKREATTHVRFGWNGTKRFLADFNATPGEENGRYLTEAEKNQILQDANIPKSPPDH